MSESINFIAGCENQGERIDKYISEHTQLTRTAAAHIIDGGYVSVGGRCVGKNYRIKTHDDITVIIPDSKPMTAQPQNIPLDIIYEDNDLLIVNKPKGMVVHPAPGNPDNTLVNALLYHCKGSLSGINGVIRPGIVHRIDKDTSGLLVAAKNDLAHTGLAQQIKEHSFHRAYEAVVCGNIKDDFGTVNAPIGRNPKDRKKMAVVYKNSKDAVTDYSVIKRYGDYTHIRCVLQTGRTHQIRVHMAYIGHPLAGDEVYGRKGNIKGLEGQCLHAKELGFIHPITGNYMEFISDLPAYFTELIRKLDLRQ